MEVFHETEAFDSKDFFLGPSNITDRASSSTYSSSAEDPGSNDTSSRSSRNVSGSESVQHDSKSRRQATRPLSTNIGPQAKAGDLDDWICLGSIRLFRNPDDDTDSPWLMQTSSAREEFPGRGFHAAHQRRLLHFDVVGHAGRNDKAVARVYVLPEDVKRSARGFMKDLRPLIKRLLPTIDTLPETYHGCFDDSTPPRLYDVPSAEQEESLFYIFNTLDSPQASYEQLTATPHSQEAMGDILDDGIPGLTATLFPYQKRSVAAMLKREEDPAVSPDQRKPKYHDLRGRPFYMDVFDGIVLQNPQLYTEPRGGILAETMGYGKTLACIALILSTRGHYPRIPDGRIDTAARKRHDGVPSLLTMAARSLKQAGMPWKAEFYAMSQAGYHYERCLKELGNHEREFAEPIFHPTTPGRRVSSRESERILRLCFATLVIVPPNLVGHWKQEIEKHTEPGSLDVLTIDMSMKQMPSWEELMCCDVVLISKNRLDQEYRDDDLHQGRRFAGQERYQSPLTDVRWLRVICDEGHAFAGSSAKTHGMAMLEKMSFERRWIISGTPSSSLHGVEVNLAATETQEEPRKQSLNSALQQRKALDSVEQETKDMDRLRLIVTNFLKLQPWANQKGVDRPNWNKYLAPFDAAGRRRCAPGLRPLLQSLMVRHKIEDIDIDVILPPLHNKTVYLEPSYYDKLSINLFLLTLVSNAVTSERVDEDYMFHPKNRRQLEILITNLRQSSFHWVGHTEHDIAETTRVSDSYFDDHLDTISDEDGLLLTEAIMNGEKALNDSGWRAFSVLHEIGVYVEDFPEHAAEAWSLDGKPSNPLLMGTTQARLAQQHIRKHLQTGDPTSGLIGAGLRAMNDARKRATEDSKTKKSTPSNSSSTSQLPINMTEEPQLKPSLASHRTTRTHPSKRRHSVATAGLPPTCSLPPTKILGFTSSKLTYLTSRLLHTHPAEKTIIFYSFPNIAFWIAEALELLSIPFLIYASTLPPATRARYLEIFNTPIPSPTSTNTSTNAPRVLLMDLRQASHGLHIAAASRIYLVTPIWSPGVEAQAIKRAHRIGQTREVFVETLVLRGTVEEAMWRRRKEVGEREMRVNAGKGWVEDEGVRGVLQGSGFVGFEEGEGLKVSGEGVEVGPTRFGVPVSMFGLVDETLKVRVGDVGGEVERKKRKVVSFGKVTKRGGVRFEGELGTGGKGMECAADVTMPSKPTS